MTRHPTRRPRTALALAAVAVLALLAGCTHVPRDVPATPAGLDGAAARTGAAQAALDALAAADPMLRRQGDWARAQCFVQHAYSERHENEDTGFVADALGQAEAIAAALRSGTPVPPTRLVNHEQRMRPDLWAAAERWRGDRCAQATAGCLEVQLVRAGHEHHTMGWRQSTGHFAIAEDLAAQAAGEAAACAVAMPAVITAPAAPAAVVEPPGAAPVPAVMPVPSVAPSPPVAPQSITLRADLLFRFDRARLEELLPAGRRELDAVAARLTAAGDGPVRVIGHSDPEGDAGYNLRLSQRRAETVKALLVQRGVAAGRITAEGRGEQEPVQACDRRTMKRPALLACNQANRRVVLEFEAPPAQP